LHDVHGFAVYEEVNSEIVVVVVFDACAEVGGIWRL
jgi:hypothetical protein